MYFIVSQPSAVTTPKPLEPYTGHSGFWINPNFGGKIGEYRELMQCPYDSNHEKAFNYDRLGIERKRWKEEGGKGPAPHFFLLCDVKAYSSSISRGGTGATFAYQFTSTPQSSMVKQMAAKIAGGEAEGGKFLTRDLDDVILQLDGSSKAFDKEGGYETVMGRLLEYLKFVTTMDRAYKERGKRLNFFLLDITLTRGTLNTVESMKGWERWDLEAGEVVETFAKENDIMVVLVPLLGGEANGGQPKFKHDKQNDWHYSRAGQFYHAEGFINAYICARGI
ncbi:hypothetical protein TrLO_g15910 [Triparma laevis f. longispina]|uniref:Uncharacterized protein n=1 Tax=Triparma laevis f. longispina TaxID=1714387 RepID=A0A9W6ZZP2_9STRA|nr:hypothetical protein TrLO_g15910 [Triparma laevis f. longispina]